MLEGLSPRAVELIRTGATLGLTFELDEVAGALGLRVAALVAPLEETIGRGLVIADAAGVRFRDPLLRADMLASLPEPVRRALLAEACPEPGPAAAAAVPAVPAVRLPRPSGITEAVRHLFAAGCVNEAVGLASSLVSGDIGPAESAVLRRSLAHALLLRGEPGPALDHLLALQSQHGDLPAEQLTLIRADHLLTLWFHDEAAAVRDAQRLTREGTGDEAPAAETVIAGLICAFVTWTAGDLQQALSRGRAAVHAAAAFDDLNLAVWTRLLAGHLFGCLGQQDEARAAVEDARRLVDLHDGTPYLPAVQTLSAMVRLRDGVDELTETEARAAVVLAERFGLALVLPFALAALARVELLRDRPAEAAAAVGRARRALARLPGRVDATAIDWVAALVEAELGTDDQLLWRAGALPDSPVLAREPSAGPLLVRSALAADEPEVALELARRLQLLAERNPEISSAAAAHAHAEGLVRQRPSGLAEAALRHTDSLARRLATSDLDELVSAPGERPSAARTAGPVGSLTPAERKVAECVAAGMTNRQVARRLEISPHTVNFHLRGIFKKFGVSSRIEVARLVDPPGDL